MRLSEHRHLGGRQEARPAARQRGFTLIETSIALLVMMIAGVGAISLFVYAIRNNSLAGARLAALAVAQQRIERLRNAPYDDPSLDPGTTTETVAAGGGSYTVQITVCTTTACGGSDTTKRITLQVTPVNANNEQVNTASAVVLQTERAAIVTGPYLQ